MTQSHLKELRRAQKLTQEELASRTGISVRTIARYEKDASMLRRAKYDTLKEIAEQLSVTVNDIFT
ncbi:XRE family transcriptional regulator [Streptococcus iniae]|uniref:Cro/Cl family transcriptional regulator n=1 Tax=Streptococcus iniae TaxID=1346 RepID=A0A1J0N127_STRIN|nr:helix-turn-helix transcriptional regulator [Streptococcus iniae]AGM99593.1 hypothetical protein K710_1843 [Streptococcus iniae SF1]AHY16510.1 Cro/Cl family transcriptional regulator [Streptococcus iniae]AHY18374.1 Cro/Cl family transcriptional regulator [Streptococcus iniae]AJG26658.1 Cro/Cl family transcriptional regulator [Streptococcus iniae]APD32532.1 transcriptional regulator [Streptococcus iniae]